MGTCQCASFWEHKYETSLVRRALVWATHAHTGTQIQYLQCSFHSNYPLSEAHSQPPATHLSLNVTPIFMHHKLIEKWAMVFGNEGVELNLGTKILTLSWWAWRETRKALHTNAFLRFITQSNIWNRLSGTRERERCTMLLLLIWEALSYFSEPKYLSQVSIVLDPLLQCNLASPIPEARRRRALFIKPSPACLPSTPSVVLLALLLIANMDTQEIPYQSLHCAMQSMSVVSSKFRVGTFQRRISWGLWLLDSNF